MAQRGRKNKYETHVKPHLKEIEQWAATMTEQQITKKLGVSYGQWFEYKKKYSELTETIKRGQQDLVSELRSALIKRACGFTCTETKTTIEGGMVTKIERTQKIVPPDVAAINLALKNYDRGNWSNDWQMYELRKKELELREKQIENNSW